MARTVSVLVGLAWLCVGNTLAAANCNSVLDCHLGTTADDLKQWINNQLQCTCVNNPSCTCNNKPLTLEQCKDARTIALIRAPQYISTCDRGLGTLRDRVYKACKNIDPDVGKYLETDRACAQRFNMAETIYSTVYAVVAVLAYFVNARNIAGWGPKGTKVSFAGFDMKI